MLNQNIPKMLCQFVNINDLKKSQNEKTDYLSLKKTVCSYTF